MLNSRKFAVLPGTLLLLLSMVATVQGLEEAECRFCHGDSWAVADRHHRPDRVEAHELCMSCHSASDPDQLIIIRNCVASGCHRGNDLPSGCKPAFVWCEITNSENTITPVIPQIPKGETVTLTVTVGNNSDRARTTLIGTRVTKPDGSMTRFLYGPFNVYFTSYESKSGQMMHTVPTHPDWPPGIYTYHVYVGKYGVILEECQLKFEVTDE